MRLSLLGLAAAGLAAAAAGAAGMPPAPLPVFGLTGASPNVKLVALDPRTLTPLASPRPLRVGRPLKADPNIVPGGQVAPALSPSGDRVALPTASALLVVGRARLRVLRRISGDQYPAIGSQASWAVVWSRSGGFILVGFGPSLVLTGFGSVEAEENANTEFQTLEVGWVRTPDGLVVLTPATAGGSLLEPWTPAEGEGIAVQLPFDATTAWATDSHHRRIFAISASGTVAVVNLQTGNVDYQTVVLPTALATTRFRAEWAGGNQLALVGASGLTLIDTRDWSVRQLDPAITDIAPAPHALVAWNRTTPTGITVYGPDGSIRFRALAGKQVHSVGVTARYAYADTKTSRFSIDLRTGQVTGPLSSRARLILPDLGLLDLP